MDVYSVDFPKEAGWQVLDTGKSSVLLFNSKLTDALKEGLLEQCLGLKGVSLKRLRASQDREYADAYQRFCAELTLPSDYVRMMCDAKYTRHFFSDSEIAAMRERWME